MTVLVLSPLYPDDALGGLAVVREPREDVEAILTMPAFPVTGDDMDALPGLRVVATGTIGYDHIDVDAAAARGVWVCNVPDYCVEEVADHTLALLLALTRGVVALDRDVRAGRWDPRAAGPLRTLARLRVGIVGHGRIGGAALDVLPEEPPPEVPQLPNLIVTPHAAWQSAEAERKAIADAVEAVRTALRGERPSTAVPETWETRA